MQDLAIISSYVDIFYFELSSIFACAAYAKRLFPEEPVIVDYQFFSVSQRLRGKQLMLSNLFEA